MKHDATEVIHVAPRSDHKHRAAPDGNRESGRRYSARRRAILLAGAGLPALLISAAPSAQVSDELMSTVREYAGGKPLQTGRIKFDIATIVENGNSVPVTISVESPMTPVDHVKSIAIFNQKNPQRDVVVTRLGPHAGRARMSTRIRLATSQHLIAIAELSDGSYWSQGVDVIVALAACIE